MQVTQETGVWSLGQEDPLEEEMATHSHILARKIPWIEKPSRLQSMRLQRVGHDWVTELTQPHKLTLMLPEDVNTLIWNHNGNKGICGQINLENWLSSEGEKEFILDVCPISDPLEPELFYFWFSKANRTHNKCIVQSLSHVWLFVTPWAATHQASLFSIPQSLFKLMSIESVMLFNHLISVIPFPSCLRSFPASGSFPMSQLF